MAHKKYALKLAARPFSIQPWESDRLTPLEWAILRTVAYADIFDFPLTLEEIHRYLIGIGSSFHRVEQALFRGRLVPELLIHHQNYFTLPGREHIIQTRQHRAVIAGQLWPKAVNYGKMIASLPFVRMVAVTGALAMDNVGFDADMDFVVVTEPGRLWLCRAMVILLVRMAALRGDRICPNLFLSENSLLYSQHDLYTAHEMIQMVPVAGFEVYQRMMLLNLWTRDYLPNAYRSKKYARESQHSYSLRKILEIVLKAPLINPIERWEMNRKIVKFSQQTKKGSRANFCADWCKGYLDAHEQRVSITYAQRMRTIGEDLEQRKLIVDTSGVVSIFSGESE